MADYNFSDISEAKRRVQEMKSRAREQTSTSSESLASIIARLSSNRDKAFVIAMMYLTSSETADESLISAVLYFLFN